MRPDKALRWLAVFALISLASQPAKASVHLMQIEQVIGGFCGDVTSQAVQLRMRSALQNQVNGAQLVAYDASGANPVVLITFPGTVAISAAGSRILVASTQFTSTQVPAPDFTMTNLIPESYLAAGRLTFESSGGTIFWSLSWGGAAYTGATTGGFDNDADGDFGPSFSAPLPLSGSQALQFQGSFADPSTTNDQDYAITSVAAQFTNNAGTSGTVIDCIFGDGFESGGVTFWS